MKCDEFKEMIREKFSGGISRDREYLLEKHLPSCDECRKMHDEQKLLSEGIHDLDTTSLRKESLDSFSRLAQSVRSYREPKPLFHGVFELKGMRVASVVAALLLITIGLSSMNYSYSYTSGASVKISFEPPLQRMGSIPENEFCMRVNDTISHALPKPDEEMSIEWACALESNALRSISVDVKTADADKIAGVYGMLLDRYPSLSKGVVSVSPLREEVSEPFYMVVMSRKKDKIDEDEIRDVVSDDFQKVVTQSRERSKQIKINSNNVRQAIEKILPEIRMMVGDLTIIPDNVGVRVITTPQERGGGQVIMATNRDAARILKDEIGKLLAKKGVNLNAIRYEQLFNIESNGTKTRITIGDTGNLFAPSSVDGWGISIFRGSGGGVQLNGLERIVKSSEIDELLMGNLSPMELEQIVERRMKDNPTDNEKVIIEVWKGAKQAEIVIGDNDAKIEFTPSKLPKFAPSTEYPFEDINDQLRSYLDSAENEREVILKDADGASNNNPELPLPTFSERQGFLPPFLTEQDLRKLVEGKISTTELERIAEERITTDGLSISNQNIFLIRDSKAITVKTFEKNVVIEMQNWSGLGNDANSMVVTFKDKDKDKSNGLLSPNDIFDEGIISEKEIDEIINGELLTSIAEEFIVERLNARYAKTWESQTFKVEKQFGEKLVTVYLSKGKVKITVE